MKFTIQEFRNYLLLQDSIGDIFYNLSEENVKDANVAGHDIFEDVEDDLNELDNFNHTRS